ncbi:hypothetical protein CLH62_17945 [Marinobacter guineae]|uniref:DUF1206 domain-containing protein n=1 Tax=Marinobacter guineae TaxID=432303 RepID=A0A2G1VB75_9GAMM|nr:DUF1206 domain-containing protein [Marinobacter guineae]PHQ24005.1 hypothetical protein CLH62_17945 [Marinobacter guineae]
MAISSNTPDHHFAITLIARAGYGARGIVYLLVGAVGVALTSASVAHGIKAMKTQFNRHFSLPMKIKNWAYPICRFGLVIRGLVFVIVGAFFVMAVYQLDPDEAGGITEFFNTLRSQVFESGRA